MTSEENNIPDKPVAKNKKQRVQWLTALITLFTIFAVIGAIYWIVVGRFYESTDDAYVSGNIIQVMPQITGQVTKILADETNLVTKGKPLVILDNADTTISLQRAESELALVVRQVSQLYNNVDQLRSNVALQEDNLQKAQDDYQRREGLAIDKVISREDLDHAKIAVDAAVNSVASAKKELASAISLAGNTDLYNHPQIQQAATNLRNAYLNWRRTIIYASETGYIAKRPVQVGQQVGPNTVLMTIVPLNQVWVDANFKESQLINMRIGQPVKVISDIYGGKVKYHGTVEGLSPGTGSAFDLLPPQNATGNWIKIVQRLPVRIHVNSQELEKHPLQIGLSVTATVDTHSRTGASLTKTSKSNILYEAENYSDDLQQANQMINQILQKNSKDLSPPAPQ